MPNPGTDIEIVTTPAVNLPPTPQSGRWFVAGATQRGPITEAVVVNSLEAYETVYGGRDGSPWVYDQVRLAFMEKLGDVCVGRSVGSSAVASSAKLTSAVGVGSLSAATGAASTLTVIASGGTFKLTVDSVSTSNLAYNISKADFETALSALSLSPKTFVVTRTVTANGLTFAIAVSGTGSTGTTFALHADTALTNGNALAISASNPGTWGDGLDFVLAAGSVDDTYKATVTLDDEVVEAYDNIADLADLLAVPWVYVALASVSGNAVMPANGTASLTGGADDDPTDTETMDAVDALFVYDLGPGLVSVPGLSGVAAVGGSTVGELLEAHCTTNRRIGMVSGSLAEPKATAKSNAALLVSGEAGSHVGYANTWIKVVMGGVLRSIPADGLVAGLRAVAHREAGPGQPPAGKLWGRSTSGAVRGVVTNSTAIEAAELRAAFVTPIRSINGDVVVYGWWALTTLQNDYPMLYVRDIVNTVAWEADRIVEDYVFSSVGIRRHLLGTLEGLLNGLGRRWADAGALHPRTVQIDNGLGGRTNKVVDPGYVVDLSANTDELLATNTVIADMQIRPVPNAAHIRIRIHKAPVRASV